MSDADVFVAEAVLAIDDKQWDRALELLRQALARSPGHVEALYYTGVAYLGKRQPAAAIPPLTQAYAGRAERHVDRLPARARLLRPRAVRPRRAPARVGLRA